MAASLRALRVALSPLVTRQATVGASNAFARARPVCGLAASAVEDGERLAYGDAARKMAALVAMGTALLGYASLDVAKAEVSDMCC